METKSDAGGSGNRPKGRCRTDRSEKTVKALWIIFWSGCVLLVILFIAICVVNHTTFSQAREEQTVALKKAKAEVAALSEATISAQAAIGACEGTSCSYDADRHLRELVMKAQKVIQAPLEEAKNEGDLDLLAANTEVLRKKGVQVAKLTEELRQATKQLAASAAKAQPEASTPANGDSGSNDGTARSGGDSATRRGSGGPQQGSKPTGTQGRTGGTQAPPARPQPGGAQYGGEGKDGWHTVTPPKDGDFELCLEGGSDGKATYVRCP